MMEQKKYVDESWKESAAQEKERLEDITRAEIIDKSIAGTKVPDAARMNSQDVTRGHGPVDPMGDSSSATATEEDFINYISSLAYQAMIFIGEIPNPVTNQTEQNIQQAKFVIDTLILLQEKTQGNLTKKEEDVLNTAAYELQMKYVEISQYKEA